VVWPREGSLIPILNLCFELFTTILSGQKSPEHMVEKSSLGTGILKGYMSLEKPVQTIWNFKQSQGGLPPQGIDRIAPNLF